MDICQSTGRFPVIDLRSCHAPTCFIRKIYSETPVFLPRVVNSRRQARLSASETLDNRMFILGMGFVGKFFAQELKSQGWTVRGSCTSLAKKKKLEEMGFDAWVLMQMNQSEPEFMDSLNHHTHLLVSIPPVVGIGDPILQHEELLKSRLMDGNLKWICYLSSTSVYGSCGGVLVDEDYPVSPVDEKAKRRLAAECGWLNFGQDLGISTQVFRLGGIYGPGRSAVDTIIKQEPLSEIQRMRASRHFTSRIHVADICQALMASIDKPSSCPGKIYNIVDDDPSPRLEVFSYAWDLVDRKWPGHIKHRGPLHGSPPFSTDTSRMGEKRVSNIRMKEELGVRLIHPSYKSGLKNIVEHMKNNPFL
ncbi:hypothetical protein NMG60_11024388 [Bertholletia excelsa]